MISSDITRCPCCQQVSVSGEDTWMWMLREVFTAIMLKLYTDLFLTGCLLCKLCQGLFVKRFVENLCSQVTGNACYMAWYAHGGYFTVVMGTGYKSNCIAQREKVMITIIRLAKKDVVRVPMKDKPLDSKHLWFVCQAKCSSRPKCLNMRHTSTTKHYWSSYTWTITSIQLILEH